MSSQLIEYRWGHNGVPLSILVLYLQFNSVRRSLQVIIWYLLLHPGTHIFGHVGNARTTLGVGYHDTSDTSQTDCVLNGMCLYCPAGKTLNILKRVWAVLPWTTLSRTLRDLRTSRTRLERRRWERWSSCQSSISSGITIFSRKCRQLILIRLQKDGQCAPWGTLIMTGRFHDRGEHRYDWLLSSWRSY